MRGSKKFCQMGSKFGNFCLVDEGNGDPNATIRGHFRPTSETPFKPRFAGVLMMTQH